ncbi:MAG TPA: nuclear transport factor 2 family protein [Actinomycetota bacterium]|nr:nuclear transport factor 2 family protein [Actinomycetota bacterium]
MHPNERLLRREYEARARRDDVSLGDQFSDGIVWHVPGHNAIAGEYHGKREVMQYVRRRRELSDETFEITIEDVLANDRYGLVIASGTASRDGVVHEWRAHGVYRFEDGLIAECWIVPEDQHTFDEVWS